MSVEPMGYDWPKPQGADTKQVVYITGTGGSAIGNGGHIQEMFVGVGGQWQVADLTALTGGPLANRGAAGVTLAGYAWSAGGTKQVVYIDTNGHIQEMFVGVGGQWQVADLTTPTGGPIATSGLAGYDWPQGGTKQVVYKDANDHIQEMYVGMGSPWQVADLTALTGGPLLGQGNITGYAW